MASNLDLLINIKSSNLNAVTQINTAFNNLTQTAQKVNAGFTSMNNGLNKFLGFFIGAAGIRKAINEFDNLDDATNRLSSSLDRANRNTVSYNKALSDQASQLSRVNNFTVAQITNTQAIVETLNLAEDQTIRFTKSISQFADESGQDLESVTLAFTKLAQAGELPKGLKGLNINTKGFENLNVSSRAESIITQIPLQSKNGNELKGLLVQLENLFGNLGRSLNTILGPALTFVNDLLQKINASPVLSSIIGGALTTGAIVVSLSGIFSLLPKLIFALETLSATIGLSAGLNAFKSSNFVIGAKIDKAVEDFESGKLIFKGARDGASFDDLVKGATITGKGSSTTSAIFSKLTTKSGLLEVLDAFALAGEKFVTKVITFAPQLLKVGVVITTIVALIAVLGKTLQGFFQGISGYFDGLTIGKETFASIKKAFLDVNNTIEEFIPTMTSLGDACLAAGLAIADLVVGLGTLVAGISRFSPVLVSAGLSLTSQALENDPTKRFNKIQEDRRKAEEAKQIEEGKAAKIAKDAAVAAAVKAAEDQRKAIEIENRKQDLAIKKNRVDQGFSSDGKRNIQGEIDSLSNSIDPKDRLAALARQNDLEAERFDILQQELSILTAQKALLDNSNLQTADELKRRQDLDQALDNNLLNTVKLGDAVTENGNKLKANTKELEKSQEIFKNEIKLQVLRNAGADKEADILQSQLEIQQLVNQAKDLGLKIDDTLLKVLIKQKDIQNEILDSQRKTQLLKSQGELDNLVAQNKAITNPEFGDSKARFERQKANLEAIKLRAGLDLAKAEDPNNLDSSPQKIIDANIALEQANKNLNDLINSSSILSDVVGDNLVSAFDSLVEGTKSAAEAMKDLLRGIIVSITEVLIKAASLRVATTLFGGATGAGQGFTDLIGKFPSGGLVTAQSGPQISADGHRLISALPGEMVISGAKVGNFANVQSSAPVINNFNVLNESDFYRAMAKTQGAAVTINNIRLNSGALGR